MTVKLHTEAIRNMAVFIKYTGVQPKDCIEEGDCIYFVVVGPQMTAALGRDARNVRALSNALKKKVKLLPYYKEPEEMVRAMIPQAREIRQENGGYIVTVPFSERAKVIGKNGSNIKAMKAVMKRHFSVADLKVRA